MKKLNLSLAAIFAMGTFAIAGGDIAPVEPVVEEPVVVESAGNFYLGLAYGYANLNLTETTTTAPITSTEWVDDSYNGRYWFGLDEDFGVLPNEVNIDTWGIYVKPQYPVTEAFNVYALLGYANTDQGNAFEDTTLDGFSWGLGASYAFTENVSVFIDYVNMYDDTENYVGYDDEYTIDTWNFGVTYNF